MTTTARDIMTESVECARTTDTLLDAARKLRDLDVGALPICGEDNRLQGMVTDRDIVVKCIADGGDPSSVTVAELAEGKPVTIGADDSVQEALRTMSEHGVRRLPVIDGHDLVGMVSQADIAKNLPDESVADLLRGHLLGAVQHLSLAPTPQRELADCHHRLALGNQIGVHAPAEPGFVPHGRGWGTRPGWSD